jgi:putative ABC transport system permease protein
MPDAGEINRRFYTALLFVYPAAFRREFGQEMIEVFCDQIQDASQRAGWIGVAGVWHCVGSELFRTALSSHLHLVGISLVSILSSLGIFCTFFWFIFGRH